MAAFESGFLPAELAVVVSNVQGAPILDKAQARGQKTELVPSRGRPRPEHEAELLACLQRNRVEHLLLAGYMRLLSPEFIAAWPGAILNIHPSLLPEFPGLSAVAAQWRAGVRIAGATVHFVDAGVDTGPILLQGSLEVRGDEGPEGLAQRILTEVEHVLYPRAVRLFLERLQRGAAPPVHGAVSTKGAS
jgi:phosphoribosylglycinamide formyltransferase-1